MPNTNAFFDSVELHRTFDDLTSLDAYQPLPDDWFVGIADIVNSTGLIEAGEYKKINTIGAAVISAQINGANNRRFPFIFGGDGAAFAFWPEHKETAREGLAAVSRMALEEFGVELRAAIVPLGAIREAGHDVTVARYSASAHADYAMFSGGGIAWADKQMKAGSFAVPIAKPGTVPDLTGLSCRWTPMKNKNGTMLSLVMVPKLGAPQEAVSEVLHGIVELTDNLEATGNPVRPIKSAIKRPSVGVDIEARLQRGTGSLLIQQLRAFLTTTIALFLFKSGFKVAGFDPQHYLNVAAMNADFRKFDDGLKLTIDCDGSTTQKLRSLLEDARRRGVIDFGLVEQEAALVTCIVPSLIADDHIHFVDGASGGYTAAAAQIKREALVA